MSKKAKRKPPAVPKVNLLDPTIKPAGTNSVAPSKTICTKQLFSEVIVQRHPAWRLGRSPGVFQHFAFFVEVGMGHTGHLIQQMKRPQRARISRYGSADLAPFQVRHGKS